MVPVSGRQNLIQIGIFGLIGLGAVVGTVVLAWHGSLSGDAAAGLLATAFSLAGAAALGQGTLNSVVNGKSVVSSELLREQGANQRTAIVAAAAGGAAEVTPVEPMRPSEPESGDGA